MSIGKVSVSRPLSTPKAASLETPRAEAKTTPVSARTGGSSFEAAPAGRPMVDLQGGSFDVKGGVNEVPEVDAARVELLRGKLEAYGITLSGDWNSPDELAALLRTVRTLDVKLKRLMKAEGETGFATGELFQRVFGQVTFERVDQPELSPHKYAEQSGYNPATGTSTIRVSDKAFTVTQNSAGLALSPEQLLGHELAHIINRRFLGSNGQPFGANESLVPAPSQTLGFAARSDNSGPEWAADVFANSLMGSLNEGNKEYAGRVRDTLLYLMSDDARMTQP